MGEGVLAAVALIVGAASAAAGAAYTIVHGQDVAAEQKKQADAVRAQYGIGANQDPLQQITAKFNAETQLVNQTATQLAAAQQTIADDKAKQQKVLTIALVGGGALTLFLLLKK